MLQGALALPGDSPVNMSRILVLSPHPDDEAIGCGGTLLRHVGQGDNVRVVFLTSGEKGGHGRSEADTLRVREQEAREAARILGVRQQEFWREPDGALKATAAVVDSVSANSQPRTQSQRMRTNKRRCTLLPPT